jgi:hypothetical protein
MTLDLKEIKIPENDDISIGMLQVQYSEKEEKRVIRKIDCFMLPVVSGDF